MSHSRRYVPPILSLVTLSFVCLQLFLPPSFAPAWLGLALFGSSASIRLDIPIPLVTGAVFTIDSTNSPLFHPVNFYGLTLLVLSALLAVLAVYSILRIRRYRAQRFDWIEARTRMHDDARNGVLDLDSYFLSGKQAMYYMGLYTRGQESRARILEERISSMADLHRKMLWACSQSEFNLLHNLLYYEEMAARDISRAGLTQYEEIKSMNEEMEL